MAMIVEACFVTSGSPNAALTTAASTCAASTRSPSDVPTHASACSGTVRYSLACSCAGVTATTTTLPQGTVATTATFTSTYTPTSTISHTTTATIDVTLVSTQVVPTTFETTATTAIIPALVIVTTVVDITTTIAVAPPVCSNYQFIVTADTNVGDFVTGDTPDDSAPYGFVSTNGSPSSSASFTIRSNGTVYTSNVDRWITRSGQLYYVLQSADQHADSYNIDNVYCSIGNGDSTYTGALGNLACTSGGHSINFYKCLPLTRI